MDDRKQANIERINQLWALHGPLGERHAHLDGTENLCLAFAIDRRYVVTEGVEIRLGVSFGHDAVPPDMDAALMRIPRRPGKFVFGLHQVGTKGIRLALYKRWYDAQGADCTNAVQGEERAHAILASISDADYPVWVGVWRDRNESPKVSSLHLLEDFEVVEEGAFWCPRPAPGLHVGDD